MWKSLHTETFDLDGTTPSSEGSSVSVSERWSSVTLKAWSGRCSSSHGRRRPLLPLRNTHTHTHTHTHTAHSWTITAPFTAPKNNNTVRWQGGVRLHPPPHPLLLSFHIQFSLTLNKCWLYFGSAEFLNEALGFHGPDGRFSLIRPCVAGRRERNSARLRLSCSPSHVRRSLFCLFS